METTETAEAGTKTAMSRGQSSKSRSVLTAEEQDFYKLIRLRATASGVGQPYIAAAIFRLIPISSPGLGTMGVDKFWRCYIDFEFMMEKGVEYAAGVLAHEPWHLLRDHNKRAELKKANKFPPLLWNMAGDLEINDDIETLVPEDSLFPGKGMFAEFSAGELAEIYFDKLIEEAKCGQCMKPVFKKDGDKPQSSGEGQSDNGDGADSEGENPSGQGDEGQSDEGSGEGGESQQGEGSSNGSSHGHGDSSDTCNCKTKVFKPCGSGAGNELEGYELAEGEADSVDSDEHESIKTIIAEDIKKQERGNPGSVPGHVKIWAETVLAHKPVSWKQVLRGEVKQAIAWKRGKTDYQKKRPSRRQPVKDVFYPALRSPNPRIGIAVDTSASNLHNLGVVLKEIEAIVKQVGVRGRDLLVFSVDYDTKSNLKPVTDTKKLSFVGGGGTDMRVAYKSIAEISPKVDIGIVITDGETPWLDSSPSNAIRFITVIITDPKSSYSSRTIEDAQNMLSRWSKVIVTNEAEVKH
jgi:predicted metal-dependent peptidase